VNRTVPFFALAVALAACNSDAPIPTADHMSHAGGLLLSDLTQSSQAQTLNDLKNFTASLHDVDAAQALGYNVFVGPPATEGDGCISDPTLGGMGYHYTRGVNIFDDAIDLLNPEFLVYAPKNGPRQNDVARTRLAAVEYFLPFSAKFPGPKQPGFTKAPSLHDFPSTSNLPDVPFTATDRFGGWMFHIWLWEDNPAGMFENFNASVPLCLPVAPVAGR
jgi:hypothetical protein